MLDHHAVGGTAASWSAVPRSGSVFFSTGHKIVDLCLQKQIQTLQQAHVSHQKLYNLVIIAHLCKYIGLYLDKRF